MEGTFILSGLFFITFLIIGIRLYRNFKISLKENKIKSLGEYLVHLGVTIFCYGLSLVIATVIVGMQYKIDKEQLRDEEILELLEKQDRRD